MSRYIRQTIFPHFGVEGQAKLEKARVALFGCGGLGTHIAETLVRAGVGFLHIIDRDVVEEHNLQRQGLFDEEDAKQNFPKAIAAKQRLSKINSAVSIEATIADVNFTTIDDFTKSIDLILDGSDNFALRYLINDISIKKNTPWIYAGAIGGTALSATFIPGETPCFRCLFPAPPPQELTLTCDVGGILGPALSVAAGIQTMEALKLLIGKSSLCNKQLLSIDLWDGAWQKLAVSKDNSCVACVKKQFEYLQGDNSLQTTILCGQNAVQVVGKKHEAADLESLARKLENAGKVERAPFFIRLKAEKEITIFKDLRAIVKDTTDETEALRLYARYVGC